MTDVCVYVLSRFSRSRSLRPYGPYSLPGSSAHAILQARIREWDLPDPGKEPASLTSIIELQAGSSPLAAWEAPVMKWFGTV